MASSYEPEHNDWTVQGGEAVRSSGPHTWRYRINSVTNELEVVYTCMWDTAEERDSRRWAPASDCRQTQKARARLAQAAKQSAGGKNGSLAQLNEIPRPSWLSEYTVYPERAEFCAVTRDVRSSNDELAIDVWDTTTEFPGGTCIEIYSAGRTIDEKIEFLQHAKAVVASLANPKVQFRR